MKDLKKCVLAFLFLVAIIGCKEEEIIENQIIGNTPYDSLVFTNVDVETNVVYGNSTSQGGVTEDLLMDIYAPQGDNSSNRPLIILAHGGGFLGGDKESMSSLSTFFAKSGYVVASLKYRIVDIEPTPSIMKKGVIDAMFDMRAAIRFFRKDLATSDIYSINENSIFVGGYSAGAFMGLHTAYVNSNAEILEVGGQALLDYVNASEGLEGNSGNPGYSSSIRGAISLSGALAKANFINSGEPILYSFHGTSDSVVPYYSGDADGSGVETEGPGLYHPVADAVGVTNRLHTVQNGEHDIFWSANGSYEDLRNFIYTNLLN